MADFSGERHEAHLPAIRHAAQAHARFPGSHEDPCRQGHHQRPSRQGPRSPRGLSQASPALLEGLPAARRLRGPAAFDLVFLQGRKRSGRFFSLHWLRAEPGPGLLGLVVSKKLTRNGVRRNEVKRMVRETYRRSPQALLPVNLVVRLRSMYPADARDDARRELARLLQSLS